MSALTTLLWLLCALVLTQLIDWVAGWISILRRPPEVKAVKPLFRK